MSAANAQPTSAVVGGVDTGENPTVRYRIEDDGTVRVYLMHNVLGGRAGEYVNVNPAHPDLPRLVALDAVRIPDPNTGEIPAAAVVPHRGCRGCP